MTDQTANTSSPVEKIPREWPGAFGLLKHAREVIRVNLGTTLVLAILLALLSAAPNRSQHNTHIVLLSLASLLSSYVSLLLYYTLLKSTKGEKVSFGQSLDASGRFLSYLVNAILTGLLIAVSFLLLIVPGLFVFPRLMLAHLFVIDQKLGPIEAIKASWAATEGHAGMIWGIIGAEIAFALLAVTIIGIPFTIYFLFMYTAALPIAYRYLTRSPQSSEPTAAESTV